MSISVIHLTMWEYALDYEDDPQPDWRKVAAKLLAEVIRLKAEVSLLKAKVRRRRAR